MANTLEDVEIVIDPYPMVGTNHLSISGLGCELPQIAPSRVIGHTDPGMVEYS